jgi:hypothetical protein
MHSNVDKAAADFATRQGGGGVVYLGPQTHGILTFVVGACGPDSIRLTKDRVLDRCYEIWSDYRQNDPIHQFTGAGEGGSRWIGDSYTPHSPRRLSG